MKKLCILFLIIVSNLCYSQDITIDDNLYKGILDDLFINHQPSAKGESMGRGLVANSDGHFGSYYNPALTSLNKGFNADYSYSQSESGKPSINYFGVSYGNDKIGNFGVSAYIFSKAREDNLGFKAQLKGSYYDAVYTVNYSREIVKDFYAGINLGIFHYYNYYHWSTANGYQGNFFIADGVTLDLGVLKKFEIESEDNKQIFEAGASISNFTNSKVGDTYLTPLPVTLRLGASHQLKIEKGERQAVPYPLGFFTHIQFDKVINSDYFGTFRFGEEMSLWDILFVRGGYFYSKIHDGFERDESVITFGLGLNIPINKLLLTKNTMELKVDYMKNDLNEYSRYTYNDYGKYAILSVSLNYIP
ncbi:MAG: hypothetical protein JST55_03355 [Bacteroidetes bacterium]|nr:hypothetical protein [Bacteroidota bacterium]